MPRTTEVLGSVEPRLWTRPLRELTEETTLGDRCIRFSEEVLGIRLDPWQKWFLRHALEVNPDGSFRFRTVLLLVARQNGKTTVMRVLTLWALWTGRVRLAVGTAQDLDIARLCWREAADIAVARLGEDLAGKPRRANGQEELAFANGSAYKIKATTEDAARGIPGVGLLLADELRTHRDYKAWGAMSKTTMAVPNALIVGMSNAGDDGSVVLNDLREAALAGRDPSLGIFEWSAPDGCDLDDPVAWAQANPSLGNGRLGEGALRAALATDPPAVFRTECLCQRVASLDSAVDPQAWQAAADPGVLLSRRPGESAEDADARRAGMKLVACLDVALDGEHATLVVAGRGADGRVRLEVAGAWGSEDEARRALPDLLGRIRPARFVWFPAGPAASLAVVLRDRKTLPPRCRAEELKGEAVVSACMGFAAAVRAREVLHTGDPLLAAQILTAGRVWSADGWRFGRRGAAHVDAVYAAAGAVHVARGLVDRGERWSGVVI